MNIRQLQMCITRSIAHLFIHNEKWYYKVTTLPCKIQGPMKNIKIKHHFEKKKTDGRKKEWIDKNKSESWLDIQKVGWFDAGLLEDRAGWAIRRSVL